MLRGWLRAAGHQELVHYEPDGHLRHQPVPERHHRGGAGVSAREGTVGTEQAGAGVAGAVVQLLSVESRQGDVVGDEGDRVAVLGQLRGAGQAGVRLRSPCGAGGVEPEPDGVPIGHGGVEGEGIAAGQGLGQRGLSQGEPAREHHGAGLDRLQAAWGPELEVKVAEAA